MSQDILAGYEGSPDSGNDMNLQGRNLLKEIDLTAAEFGDLVDLGGRLRMEKRMGLRSSRLAGRNIALIFEKTSTTAGDLP